MLDTGIFDPVPCLEAIEQRNTQGKLKVLVHVLFPLCPEIGILNARQAIVVRTDAGSERKLGIVGALSNLDAFFCSLHAVLGCLDGWLVHHGLGIDFLGKCKVNRKIVNVWYTDLKTFRRWQFQ